MILKTAQNKETRQKQASNIKGSCSSHRTKDTGKRNKSKLISQTEIARGGIPCRQQRRKPRQLFFLKVCYLDCAKFDGLLGVIVDDGYKVVTNVHLLRVTAWVGFTGRHQCGNMEDN